VLPGYDVFDVEGSPERHLRKITVLTAAFGAPPDVIREFTHARE
jgi:hypothetical protein